VEGGRSDALASSKILMVVLVHIEEERDEEDEGTKDRQTGAWE
jgi:hypothetical protein